MPRLIVSWMQFANISIYEKSSWSTSNILIWHGKNDRYILRNVILSNLWTSFPPNLKYWCHLPWMPNEPPNFCVLRNFYIEKMFRCRFLAMNADTNHGGHYCVKVLEMRTTRNGIAYEFRGWWPVTSIIGWVPEYKVI